MELGILLELLLELIVYETDALPTVLQRPNGKLTVVEKLDL